MATATYTANNGQNYRAGSQYTRWRQGVNPGASTTSFSYNTHVFKGLLYFTITASTFTNKIIDSIKLVITPGYYSDMVTSTISPWITSGMTSVPSGASMASMVSDLTSTTDTNSYFTERLSTFSCPATGTTTGTITSSTAQARRVLDSLVGGNPLCLFYRHLAPGSDINTTPGISYIGGEIADVDVIVTYHTPAATTAPTTVTLAGSTADQYVTGGNLTLAWSGATNGGEQTITGYDIYRNGAFYTTVTTTATSGSLSVPAHTVGNRYTYTVVTNGSMDVNSAASVGRDVYTYSAPGAPSTITINGNASTQYVLAGNVTLAWSGATYGSYNTITGYEIYKDSVLHTTVSTTATSGSTTVPAPSAGSSFSYQVKAIGQRSDSSLSGARVVYTYSDTSAPSSVSLSPAIVLGSGTSTLSWSGALAGALNTISSYEVWSSTTSGGTYTLLTSVVTTATSGSTTVTAGAGAGSTIFYKIKTVGTRSTSGFSSYAGLTVNTAPGTPTITAPANGESVSTTTPTLTVTVPAEPNGQSQQVQISIDGAPYVNYGDAVSGTGGSVTGTIGPLSYSAHTLDVRMSDSLSVVGGVASISFTIVSPVVLAQANETTTLTITSDGVVVKLANSDITANLTPIGTIIRTVLAQGAVTDLLTVSGNGFVSSFQKAETITSLSIVAGAVWTAFSQGASNTLLTATAKPLWTAFIKESLTTSLITGASALYTLLAKVNSSNSLTTEANSLATLYLKSALTTNASVSANGVYKGLMQGQSNTTLSIATNSIQSTQIMAQAVGVTLSLSPVANVGYSAVAQVNHITTLSPSGSSVPNRLVTGAVTTALTVLASAPLRNQFAQFAEDMSLTASANPWVNWFAKVGDGFSLSLGANGVISKCARTNNFTNLTPSANALYEAKSTASEGATLTLSGFAVKTQYIKQSLTVSMDALASGRVLSSFGISDLTVLTATATALPIAVAKADSVTTLVATSNPVKFSTIKASETLAVTAEANAVRTALLNFDQETTLGSVADLMYTGLPEANHVTNLSAQGNGFVASRMNGAVISTLDIGAAIDRTQLVKADVVTSLTTYGNPLFFGYLKASVASQLDIRANIGNFTWFASAQESTGLTVQAKALIDIKGARATVGTETSIVANPIRVTQAKSAVTSTLQITNLPVTLCLAKVDLTPQLVISADIFVQKFMEASEPISLVISANGTIVKVASSDTQAVLVTLVSPTLSRVSSVAERTQLTSIASLVREALLSGDISTVLSTSANAMAIGSKNTIDLIGVIGEFSLDVRIESVELKGSLSGELEFIGEL